MTLPISELLAVYRDGLLNDTLPFWTQHAVDREQGGFITSLNRDGSIVDTDKCVWQQGRFAWLLGELYNEVEPRDEWLDLAKHGADFLDQHCFDTSDGRMWFHVARDGRPIRKRRYGFSECFAAIAYGELFKATGDDAYRTKATNAFRGFINRSRHGEPKFTDTRPAQGLGVPMITIATAQELRDSIELEDANDWIDQSIETIRRDHLYEPLQCVLETVGVDGEFIDHFDGRTLNPGHAIEGAWFILAEGRHRNDAALVELGCTMLDRSWRHGWDEQYGGILYYVDAKGLPVQEYWHDMKFWWPQNEAIIATLMAWTLTGEARYRQWHHDAHQWAYEHFPDRECGEWYGYLHRDGRLSSTLKGSMWKGPFHLPRMQLLCWKMLAGMADDASAGGES